MDCQDDTFWQIFNSWPQSAACGDDTTRNLYCISNKQYYSMISGL